MGIMNACGLWSFVYSINFQIRQIQARNQHFSGEKSLLMCGSRLPKKKKKKDFCHKFSFFNRFTQTSHPLNSQNLLGITKRVCPIFPKMLSENFFKNY